MRELTSQTQAAHKFRAQENEKTVSHAYVEMAKALATSEQTEDRQLAKGLQGYLEQHGVQVRLRRQPGIR
jgi:MarR-like DNA-binding transcriptional regulator SgrR of sgrS sRNA